MDNENRPAKKGEFLMIAVVVILAFGLTVTGVVYLAKYLIGAPPANRPVVAPKADEDPVVRYSVEPDNNSTVIITDSDAAKDGDNQTSVYSSGGFRPIGILPAPFAPAPEPVPAEETPPVAVTSPPTATPPAATTLPAPAAAALSPAQLPAPNAEGKYQLQLFAFSNKDTADREAAKLKGEYPDIYVVQAEVRGGIWYRVRCCRTGSRSEAERVRSEITLKHKEIRPDIISN
ncbi:MAG: SPOR domain-containing protein [Deferribacteraceae bacterium]|jgi:cell division septation protein DedD|nr:SPOR domain-containing protein [Deferribacteraceae bacterium]